MKENPNIPYGDIPGFSVSTAPNHRGRLVVGLLGGRRVARLAEYPGFLPLLLFRGGVPRFSSFPTVVGEHPIALAMALFV